MTNSLAPLRQFPENPKDFKRQYYLYPVIYSLKNTSNGIFFTRKEIKELVVENLKITEEQLQSTISSTNKTNLIANSIDFALLSLSNSGYLEITKDKNKKNQYCLASKCKFIINEKDLLSEVSKFTKLYNKQYRLKKRLAAESCTEENCIEEAEEIIENTALSEDNNFRDWKKQMLDDLLSLSPLGFEKFCCELLRAMGLENIEHTGKSSDGGIDIRAIIKHHLFLKRNVIVQCKRYNEANKVTPSKIRELLGCREKGIENTFIFITTSSYTKEAKEMSKKDIDLELIDGDMLCDYIVQYMDKFVETHQFYNLAESKIKNFFDE